MQKPGFLFSVLLLMLFSAFPAVLLSQTAVLKGIVENEKGRPAELVNVQIVGTKLGMTTGQKGFFQLQVPAGRDLHIAISYIGYRRQDTVLRLFPGEVKTIHFRLRRITTNLPGFVVRDEQLRMENIVRLNPRDAVIAPAVAGGVESLIKTLPGVSSNNELSSQYSVRGGNYDENLVYVDGIEIYRPFLVNSGQQEGLSFINPALVSGILFSAGGFGVQYGGKMSSVLDIRYRHPTQFGAGVSLSFLGADMNVEGTDKSKRFTYLLGARYKTNRYLLGSLETKGNYQPDFTDFQGVFTYKLNKKWDISLLTYFSLNRYKVVPADRQTDFGTVQQSLRFTVYFDGQEVDKYNMFQSGLTFNYHPNSNTRLRFIASAFQTNESETYDVQGQYWIGQVGSRTQKKDQGEAVQTLGVGTYLEHARNYFDARVFTLSHKGSLSYNGNLLRWGARYQFQQVDDVLHEWELNDSAGYSLPNPVDKPGNSNPSRSNLDLYYFAHAHNTLNIHRASAYASDRWDFQLKNKSRLSLTTGVRLYWWSYANEFLISPRVSLAYKPFAHANLVFRFASGIYYQPPFYREMRNMDGSLNPNIKSQRAIHFIMGGDYRFQAGSRPFIFTTEAYYKKLDHLIPYEVDNLRIRYYANLTAKGYAAGIDFKLYGEFVKGIDSWITLSFMKTAQDVLGDYYYDYYNTAGEKLPPGKTGSVADSVKVEPGYIPRPTDRRVNFTIYFQDYIPQHKQFKVHLRLLFGTGLPFGPQQSQPYQQTLRMPPYRRVDIGFSWNPLDKNVKRLSHKTVKSMWISLEVFNLFQTYNTVSYTWIKDIYNHSFAIPNYLTMRRVNLKVAFKF
ncbi:MAG: TonB-dependent receptor [bacterium]|nr:MAG: TonB-dependent receptor [bacterium]